jgi:hypothetical protein
MGGYLVSHKKGGKKPLAKTNLTEHQSVMQSS